MAKLTWRSGLLLLLPSLAVMGPWVSTSFPSPGPVYAYRVVGLVALACLLLFRPDAKSPLAAPGKWFIALGLVAAFWAALSQYWAPDPADAIITSVNIFLVAVPAIAYLVAASETASGARRSRQGIVIAFFVLLALGLWQKWSGMALVERVGGQTIYGHNLLGPYENPNNYAVYLVACGVPVFLALSSGYRNLSSLWNVALIALSVYTLSFTNSRSGFILLALVVSAALLSRVVSNPVYLGYLYTIAATLTVIVLPRFLEASESFRSYYEMSGELESDRMRLEVTLVGLDHFLNSGGLGLGAGGLEGALTEAGFLVASPHNVFVELVAELGVAVGLILVGGAVAALRAWLKLERIRETEVRRYKLGAGIAYASVLMVAGISTSSALLEPIWWLLMAQLIIVLSMDAPKASEATKNWFSDNHGTR